MDVHMPDGAPADLFITSALDKRGKGKPDYARQARAIQDLATCMADDPDATLPRFVDLAMRLTGGTTAGLSLWEPAAEDGGVFRWRHLRGALAAFDGGTTPRHFSPCGITLDRNTAVLTLHPERIYSWISDAGLVFPEVLLVPLKLQDGRPFGTLWVIAEREGEFNRDHARLLSDLAECVSPGAAQWAPEATLN